MLDENQSWLKPSAEASLKRKFCIQNQIECLIFDLSTSAKSVCRTLKFLPSILAWRKRKTFCKGLVSDPWNSLRTVLTRPRLLISRRYLKNYDLWSVSSQSKKVFVVKNMSLTKLRDVRKRNGYELRISKDISVLQFDRF